MEASHNQGYVIDPELKRWATNRQVEFVDEVNLAGSIRAAARNIGVDNSVICRSLKTLKAKAAKMGYSPEHVMTRTVPDGYQIKGVSTYFDKDGVPRGQWVKSQIDHERQLEIMQNLIESLSEGIKPFDPVEEPQAPTEDNLLNVYTMTDCHMGMLAWAKEAGADWDINISRNILTKSFKRMVDTSPRASSCVVAQLGDWLHYDSLSAVTPTSGHILDADTRFERLVETALEVLIGLIRYALTKHETVYVLMAEGNHDMASSVWLRGAFKHLFKNDPRVKMIHTPLPYYALQHGKTMLAWHHGHLKKPAQIPLVIADQFSEIWGRTKYRYIHMGDKHHLDEKEHNGVIVLQHPTLAARDAYAARGGWKSIRSARAITYHSEYGEIFRNVVTPEMIAE